MWHFIYRHSWEDKHQASSSLSIRPWATQKQNTTYDSSSVPRNLGCHYIVLYAIPLHSNTNTKPKLCSKEEIPHNTFQGTHVHLSSLPTRKLHEVRFAPWDSPQTQMDLWANKFLQWNERRRLDKGREGRIQVKAQADLFGSIRARKRIPQQTSEQILSVLGRPYSQSFLFTPLIYWCQHRTTE